MLGSSLMSKQWRVDRFHIAFFIIAAGWIAIASFMHNLWAYQMAENVRLREACALAKP